MIEEERTVAPFDKSSVTTDKQTPTQLEVLLLEDKNVMIVAPEKPNIWNYAIRFILAIGFLFSNKHTTKFHRLKFFFLPFFFKPLSFCCRLRGRVICFKNDGNLNQNETNKSSNQRKIKWKWNYSFNRFSLRWISELIKQYENAPLPTSYQ